MADLAQSLGIRGRTTDARVIDAARHVIAAAAAAGKPVMMMAESPERAHDWVMEGMLCCGVDVPMIGRFLQHKTQFSLHKPTFNWE
jgi:2-keto-3-deoxy-L-rhamnonate aldolase RhmA